MDRTEESTEQPAAGGSVFADIEDALDDLREGKMVIVCDDEDRENEGDLTMAAQFATAEKVNFMAKEGRGLVCLCLTPQRCAELELPPMTTHNEARLQTAFTVSVEAREGVTTGISAADRAHTIQVAIAPETRPSDLVQPGHVFPLMARPGGVLERTGQTEAGVDLARLAGLNPSAVICEIMNDDGTMARVPDLVPYARRHGLKIVTVADLIKYRRRKERLIRRAATVTMPTRYGDFKAVGYESVLDGSHHVALIKGDPAGQRDVLVRVHSECLTGDTFGSLRCDCGEQLAEALRRIEAEGVGVVLHMRQEGRVIGLINQLKAYEPAGEGAGHRGGQRRVQRLAPDLRELRHRRADPRRPGPVDDQDHDQQPQEDRGAGRLRAHDHRPRTYRGHAAGRQRLLPTHEAREDGPPARTREPVRPGRGPGGMTTSSQRSRT